MNFSDICINDKDRAISLFVFNALQDGWCIKKRNNQYIFTRRNGKDKEVYKEEFLENFLKKYFIK